MSRLLLVVLLSAATASTRAQPVRTTVTGEVTPGPCAGAATLVTDDGRRYEIESKLGARRGAQLRIEGLVYPEASICGAYPWLRPDSDREQRAPIRVAPGTVQAWVDAARIAANRAEAGLPIEWSNILQLDATGPAAAVRALARMLGARTDDEAGDATPP